ncbi:MAG: glutamine--tRNA ligase, partial [Chitinophagia bacterium]|nr:glutamine--tRNA ligase [Chitinophagia bacterium]
SFIEQLGIFPSRQYEFARLNLNYTVMSKRRLLKLVNEGYVTGWDDPRMPTLSAMRRRGYPPEAIRDLCDTVGVARRENVIDLGLLEFCVRERLNKTADRVMAVLEPLKLIIDNYPEGTTEILNIENNPEANSGTRSVPFSNTLWIEQEDFMEHPPKKYFRLFPGGMVRLKGAYIVKCDRVAKDDAGNITAVHCTYLPESKSGNDTSGINVKGTIHWVSAPHAMTAEVRLYDRLFTVEDPQGEEGEFQSYLNPEALQVTTAYLEPSVGEQAPGYTCQFLRKGYFCVDTDTQPGKLVFNRTVTLKSSYTPPAAQ